ncbi:hypothetical protein G6F16_004895 [Rhizopus arrhizus]|uniref:Oxidation resistance protein 1 n=1 Tax=Rhizopus oryzae TaxID=64495 RepID=A0A9P7BX50_RHIOR|nr:hypothetical protein G6F23_009752 [Rhizopus arrhizus]KAG0789549.1 hypothetical protein G6F22_006673 [Rhizopus arrhizus]KAG0793592.1 hypothetical protein G6F21_003501 [Rhizopus arrhizus]KAG0810333.1 hypothetical protein G6F20_008044 [Rhizopus arrhizus]KAG0828057.1 hypothetical protein G6F18_009239 [Rhizopus arrhizus]
MNKTLKLFPLHRSFTDDNHNSYNDQHPSPFTCFVSKLLGLKKKEEVTRHPLKHTKSHSTTSLTKGSVILTSSTQDIILPQKTTITFAEPKSDLKQTAHDPPLSTTPAILDSPCSAALDALMHLTCRHASFVPEFDLPPIVLRGCPQETCAVLTENMAEIIRPYVPKRFRVASVWKLLYSLDQHGASLQTLYSMTRDYVGPCVWMMKDEDGQIYGAYSSHTLAYQHNTYYGTGECFLWKLTSEHQPTLPKIKVFPWTGKNDYMILCNSTFIAMGGGDGQFGLWLKSDMETGYSTPCPTFDNECLSSKSQFQCIEMEVWGFSI